MILRFITLFAAFSLFLTAPKLRAQNVLDEVNEDETSDIALPAEGAPKLVTETIKNISPSKKIFILTNDNQSYSSGDFISILLANKLVARALVAKSTPEKMAGIKIVKIYNPTLWPQLNAGKEVLILKGDDSYFNTKESNPNKAKSEDDSSKKNENKLQSEEDLYNSTTIDNDDDLNMDENAKRLIKPDNLLSFNVGLLQGQDVDGSTKRFTSLGGSWGYQLTDNFWAEASVGVNTVRDYPSTGLDTQLINITGRIKYTVNGPLYSYFQPYVGYQTVLANSPGAGVDDGTGLSATQLQAEIDLVNRQKSSGPVFGLTFLKRIVPGWFARADLGTDIINGGLAIEF